MPIFRRHSRTRSNSTPTNPTLLNTCPAHFTTNPSSTHSSGTSSYSHSPSNSHSNLDTNAFPPTSFRQYNTIGYSWRSAFKSPKSTSSLRQSSRRSPGSQTRSSTTTSNGPKSLADFGLRRRRSTGTKGRSSTGTNGSGNVGLGIAGGPGVSGPSPLSAGGSKGISSVDLPGSPTRSTGPSSIVATSSTSSTVPGSLGFAGNVGGHNGLIALAATSSISSIPSVTSSHGSRSDAQSGLKSPLTSNTLRFSTADRTILQELKASIQARDAHFVLKGIGAPIVGGGKSQGKKHHCYSIKDVPYPRAYEREVMDMDVWEIMFGFDSCQSYTWHVFETPPTKVLEIGCGTGTWVLQCARQWKDTHFVGLDIVPLHPNLQNVGSPNLASRITWVQHNFLEGLPFPNEEFDFVHIKRIALGVPEDKWDALFEEITRVMKPGGAFEMIEEDLFFPGKPVNESEEPSPVETSPKSSRHDSVTSDKLRKPTLESSFPPPSPSGSSIKTSGTDTVPSSPVTSRNSLRHLEDVGEENGVYWPAPPSSTHHSIAPSLAPTTTTTLASTPSRPSNSRASSSMPKSATRPTLSVKTQHAADSGDPLNGYGASLSVFGVMAYQPDPLLDSVLKQRGHTSSTIAGASSVSPNSASGLVSPGGDLRDGVSSIYAKKTKPSPFLLRTLTKAPNNPRNHTLLAAIWHRMLESRFINTAPLSLLAATLEYHFKDVRTHPPLLCTFPPVEIKPKTSKDADDHHSESEDDIDDARDALVPRPNRRSSSKAPKSSNVSGGDQSATTDGGPVVSYHGLLSHASPFISLDDDRIVGLSPATQANLPAIQSINEPSPLVAARPSVLPNTNLNIDLRTLNMHLMMRVKEVLASSESMWEWVQDFQASHSSGPKSALRGPPSVGPSSATLRNRAGSVESPSIFGTNRSSLDLSTQQILELTREDFDILLSNFELDMQDRTGINQVIEDRFNWHVFSSPELQDRKIFDTTCEKYDNWVAEQRVKSATATPTAQSHMSVGTHRATGSSTSAGTTPATPDTIAYGTEEGAIKPKPTLSTPSLHTTPNPSQMLSRAMRVFVAWKPDN